MTMMETLKQARTIYSVSPWIYLFMHIWRFWLYLFLWLGATVVAVFAFSMTLSIFISNENKTLDNIIIFLFLVSGFGFVVYFIHSIFKNRIVADGIVENLRQWEEEGEVGTVYKYLLSLRSNNQIQEYYLTFSSFSVLQVGMHIRMKFDTGTNDALKIDLL